MDPPRKPPRVPPRPPTGRPSPSTRALPPPSGLAPSAAPTSQVERDVRLRLAERLPVPRGWPDGDHAWRASVAEKLGRSPTLARSLEALFDRLDSLIADARRAERRLRAHGQRAEAEALRESVRRLWETRENTM